MVPVLSSFWSKRAAVTFCVQRTLLEIMVMNEHSLFQKVMSADKHFTPTVMLKVQDRQDASGQNTSISGHKPSQEVRKPVQCCLQEAGFGSWMMCCCLLVHTNNFFKKVEAEIWNETIGLNAWWTQRFALLTSHPSPGGFITHFRHNWKWRVNAADGWIRSDESVFRLTNYTPERGQTYSIKRLVN